MERGAMWLLFAVLTATASVQSMDVTYLDGAVKGYNPFIINSFIQPDPGRRSTIFQTIRKPIHSTDDKLIINQFINEAVEFKCIPDMTIQTVTDYTELHKYAISSKYRITPAVNYASPEIRYGNNAACETKSNSRDQELRQFFEETGGEVILVSAECVTHTIAIDPFEPLLFTPTFETALSRLYEAALCPASEASDTTFKDFVGFYGTHYSKQTQLGARAVLGKLFSSRSATAMEETARRSCVLEAAREALMPGMRSCNETTLTRFARASAESCNDTEHEVFALITGPLPVIGIENWATTAEELLDPIYLHLEPISTLFTRQWSSTDVKTNNIDKRTLQHFFEKKLADYSSSVFTEDLDQGQTCGRAEYANTNIMVVTNFRLITNLHYNLYTLTTPSSNSAKTVTLCALVCGSHESCGGIVWDPMTWPNCQLVVDPSEPGSAQCNSTSAFRLMTYRDGRTIKELPSDTQMVSWNYAKAACMEKGFQLLPHPTTMKERAILSIRNRNYVRADLIRRAGDDAYVDGSGQSVNETTLNWDPNNPGMGDERCLGVAFSPLAFYDYYCDVDDSDYPETWCVE